MQHKFINKIIIIGTLTLLLNGIFFGMFAETTSAAIDPKFTCEKVSTMNEGFYVILEEVMNFENSENSIVCFRVCDAEVTSHHICDLETACPDDANKTCQRVQVIRSESGAELVYTYVGLIYKWAAATIGIVSVLTIVYSGILIIASGGSDDVVTKSKERILRSLMGLVLLFLSGLILYTINPTFFV